MVLTADTMLEGVYASSGDDDITVQMWLGGNDSGSHNDAEIKYTYRGIHMSKIIIAVSFDGTIVDIDGNTVPCVFAQVNALNGDTITMDPSGKAFTITRSTIYANDNGNGSIGIQMMFNPSPNQAYLTCGAYHKSGEHMNEYTNIFSFEVTYE